MRGTQPARLLGAASLAVMTAALSFADTAQAESREARMCATQTESLAEQRIAACTGMLSAGHLHSNTEGVAYGLRGLACLDRGDIAHAIADLNQAIALAPDFAPAYQNRGNA
ncbi:MAG TPA: tetratricopeptide repeat protein [Pseudolabrys sp.]|nr:tetratricopeptide repeat protein [Pseudolabrys sp.]